MREPVNRIAEMGWSQETYRQEDISEKPEVNHSVGFKLRAPWMHLLGDRRACEVDSRSVLDRLLRRTSYLDQFLFPKPGRI